MAVCRQRPRNPCPDTSIRCRGGYMTLCHPPPGLGGGSSHPADGFSPAPEALPNFFQTLAMRCCRHMPCLVAATFALPFISCSPFRVDVAANVPKAFRDFMPACRRDTAVAYIRLFTYCAIATYPAATSISHYRSDCGGRGSICCCSTSTPRSSCGSRPAARAAGSAATGTSGTIS